MNRSESLQQGRRALDASRQALDALVRRLARHVAREGRVDGALVDRFQSETFRLTQLHAQVQAAREMVAYGERGELEALLALAFLGLTVQALRQHLPELALRLAGAGVGDAAAGPAGSTDDGATAGATAGEGAAFVARTTSDAFHGELLAAIAARQSFGADGLDHEHHLLQATVRAFAERRVRPMAERFHREDLLIPDELIRAAGELGCFSLSIPQEFGGFQERPDHVGMVVVTEELSRGALAFGSLSTRPEILAKALLRGGTPEQRARLLPEMASGRKMVAIAVTEPDFGSDVAGLTVSARPDGVDWRLNGTKTWSTFAGRAELIGVLARSEPDLGLGHRGLSMFVVEKPAYYGHAFTYDPPDGGRLSGRAIHTLGYRGMHSFELTFDDFRVPGANLVGGEAGRGRGFYLQMEAFSAGRLQTAGRASGVMQAALELAFGYGRSRMVFGKPLDAYGLTREKLARMAATVQACRQATYASARLLDAGQGQAEASMTKFLTCRQAEWITREAQQLHGGMGYAEEFPVSRLFVDARVLSIFEGTEEVLALKVIAPAMFARALEA
ncbi:MAG: acyl-CoA/acyl-ACP dehydrogenase [Candidatus Lambdaproteobacteria bacterium]|nr:acyl-CoA/acyl-ACP dehydrogenase [Candidatus Lambdaproteobacteria bacterium]